MGSKRFQIAGAGVAALALVYTLGYSGLVAIEYRADGTKSARLPELNKADYNARMLALAHIASTTPTFATATTSVAVVSTTSPSRWPVPHAYPKAGALLPFKRIVAYYGNFYSKRMGILGEYPAEEVLARLASTSEMWTKADPSTPSVPAIHYIAVVAQAEAGREGKYILRMPDDQVEHALGLARRAGGIVFLDLQVGLSTLEHELPFLEKYLRMPQVHLAIDPEFSMKGGERPGTVIGTFDAKDINYAAEYLARLVRENLLPPKILVVHRFTQKMVTNYHDIRPVPEVQIVIDMDGFGSKEKKYGTYNYVVAPEPVQFTGIKLFYKNDTRPPADGLLTPAEVLALTPAPIYIQYQ